VTPEVSVVVPLDDPRGDIVEHLRTWTREQTCERGRFQVVAIADGAHPEVTRTVANELAPHDLLVTVPAANLMRLYDDGARAASAPVLLLTEAHVRAESSCVAAVAEAFADDPELDVGTLRHHQVVDAGGISGLSARWFERAFAAWSAAGWIRLNTTGMAIRAETYARVGGLDTRLGLYAPSLLSALLDLEGARTRHLEAAGISHVLEHEMGYALELGADFTRGELVVRRERDPGFCERYFGPAGLWERRLAYRREIARAMVRGLATALRRSPGDAPWLVRELFARLPARWTRARSRLLWERARTFLHRVLAATPTLPEEARWRSYVLAQEGTVRATHLREIGSDDEPLPPLRDGGAPIGAERLGEVVVGVHGLESDGRRKFRWTEPVALLRLRLPAEGAVLRIDTGGLRGSPLGCLQGIYAAGRFVRAENVVADERVIEVRLEPAIARAAADDGLVLICRPLLPRRFGSSDRRRLGMPIFELELLDLSSSEAAAERSPARSTALA
jgi:hypothetical protein